MDCNGPVTGPIWCRLQFGFGREANRDRPEPDAPPGGRETGRRSEGPGGFGGPFGGFQFGPPGGGRGGFGGPGGPGGGGTDLDPLTGLDNERMALRSRLLAVPSLRAKYLEYVREIAEKSLDWSVMEPIVARTRDLIREDVATDTRKLDTTEAFEQATSSEPSGSGGQSLRKFFDERRKFLLEYKVSEES